MPPNHTFHNLIFDLRLIGMITIYIVLSYDYTDAQSSIHPVIGLTTWSYPDEAQSYGTSKHPGQMLGLHVLFEDHRWVFEPGFEYHRISLENEDHRFSLDFSDAHHVHYFMIPLSAGYKVADSTAIEVTALAGAEAQLFYNADANSLGLEDDDFYGVSAAMRFGLRACFFKRFTSDVHYHLGILPTLRQREMSNWRGWSISLGYIF